MKASAIFSALRTLVTAQQPVFLWGGPGIGKSAIVRQLAEHMNVLLQDVRALLLDPVDLRGLPFLGSDGRSKWAPPEFLPREGAGILFLDELNAAPAMVQASCYQLVLDRRLGEYTLPTDWAIVAAGNRDSDRAVTTRMPTPLRNRFVHLEFEVDLQGWSEWAVEAGIRPDRKRDVTARLERILRDEGISCAVMRSNIDTAKREAWYERRLKEGVEVFIAHPRLVKTGLDLLFAPTIIFHESGYSLHTLRQASRRSWRIGQQQPVRVKFLCYEGTMQAKCLRLMGKKLLVALAMEGKFTGEGLQSLDEDDDMLTSMAKELVEKNRIGDSADAVWRQLNAEHQRLFPARPEDKSTMETPPCTALEQPAPSNSLIATALNSRAVLVFGQRPDPLRRARRTRAAVAEQGLLFR